MLPMIITLKYNVSNEMRILIYCYIDNSNEDIDDNVSMMIAIAVIIMIFIDHFMIHCYY